jgi:hypothetical protein
MELKEFVITALPFAQSELAATFEEYAVDDETALKQFQARYPLFRVKEVKER